MAKDLNKALETVEMTYSQIKEIADNMLSGPFSEVNSIIDNISYRVETLTLEELRDYMLKLQLQAFSLSELRDRTGVKAICAESVKKEAYASAYLGHDGTQSAKDAQSTLEVSDNIVVECLYELVASLVKTKVDQIHRMIDTLKSILMSRMQQAKLDAADLRE